MSVRLTQLFEASWYEHLHRFNFLPSQILHPSWVFRFSPQDVITTLSPQLPPADLHRHWSAHILVLLGLADRPCLDPSAPLLPLAILPAPMFDRLVMLAGLSLAGKALRQLIRRDDITTLRRVLAPDLLAFVLQDAPLLHPGLDLGQRAVQQLLELPGPLGASALLSAMQGAPDEMFERVRLRLDAATAVPLLMPLASEVTTDAPHDAPGDAPHDADRQPFPLDNNEALALMLRITDFLDPAWLSSFELPH